MQGRTPLHVAAGRGSEDAVALLLDYGGKYSLKDGHGLTPLLEACRAGQDAVIRVFTSRNIRWGGESLMHSYATVPIILLPGTWTVTVLATTDPRAVT
jgi:ankyrin repeat protein